MEKKRALRGRRERIIEDRTWKERKMRWHLESIAAREEREGRRVRIGYGRIWIDGWLWRWDERKMVLRDRGGRERQRAAERTRKEDRKAEEAGDRREEKGAEEVGDGREGKEAEGRQEGERRERRGQRRAGGWQL